MAARPEPAAASASLDDRVREAQVRHLYEELPTAVSASLAGAVLLGAVMWGRVAPAVILAWAGAMAANQAWRLVLHLRFRRRGGLAADEVRRWGATWAVGSAISGLVWGSAAFLFWVEGSAALQTVLIVSLFAVTSGAVLLIGTHLPSFYAFVLCALAPVVGRMLVQGTETHLLLAFITTVATFAILVFGRGYNRTLVDSLRNRFQNEALAEALAARNAALEEARRAAEAARQEAEAANRSKTQFFAAASHDLRQPLHALGLFAGMLSARARDAETASVARSIAASVDALESLFSELLDISRIDAGAIRVNPQPFAIQGLLDRVQTDFAPEAAERGLGLRFRPSRAWARSDPVLVERILRNLVSNALRYTNEGGVLVACRSRGATLSLEVWDTGVGIREQERERVFEPFHRGAATAEGEAKGLGLGLAIVKRLAGLVGAAVTFRSRPEVGTVFRLMLARAEPPPLPVAARRRAESMTLAGRCILVIDDEARVLESTRALLTSWEAEVVAAPSVARALAEADALDRAPDLLIVDDRLGDGIDGVRAIELVRERFGAAIPAIVVTGSAAPSLTEAAGAKGLHVLAKPVAPAKLRSLIGFKLAR
ncbi:MAG: hybrid sensor histidine kinase/response regulator [Burkholderiales bacterium]|nr:hybrid sensor histidine kinase/response regulator [Burkholderiales bacterium]